MIKQIKKEEFEKVIKDKVLVDFSASWCGPCKMMGMLLDNVESNINIPIYKVDIDDERLLAEEYNIYSVPTLIIFNNSKEVKRIIGLQDKDSLIKQVMDSE